MALNQGALWAMPKWSIFEQLAEALSLQTLFFCLYGGFINA